MHKTNNKQKTNIIESNQQQLPSARYSCTSLQPCVIMDAKFALWLIGMNRNVQFNRGRLIWYTCQIIQHLLAITHLFIYKIKIN